MTSAFPEIESVLDDWVRLRNSTVRTRQLPQSLLLQLYTPPHAMSDAVSPLQWRKKALKEKWSGSVLDTDVKNGSALLGLGSCKDIEYLGVVPNYRHRMAFERMTRVLGIRATFYPRLQDVPKKILSASRILHE